MILLLCGILIIAAAIFVLITEYQQVKDEVCVFPNESYLVNVPVGGLLAEEAEERLSSAFMQPIEVQLNGHFFHLMPEVIGFRVDEEAMISAALSDCMEKTNWERLNDRLWNTKSQAIVAPELIWSFDEDQYQSFINAEILPRYETTGTNAYPLDGGTQFVLSSAGAKIDQALLRERILNELIFPTTRKILLPQDAEQERGLTQEMLRFQLNAVLQREDYSGLVEIYAENLSTGESISYAVNKGQMVQPEIAFTAASTMKIPILVSALSRTDLPLSDL